MNCGHLALITAKGGNQSLPNKNLIEIAGLPSFVHSLRAVKASDRFDGVWVSSEDQRILEVAQNEGAQPLQRPEELAQPLTNHGDVILHAFRKIREEVGVFETLTVLLGNTTMVRKSDLERVLDATMSDARSTGAMTVWVAQDDHPFRAMVENESGYLESFMNISEVDTNRQSYPEVLFYDQGPWSVKYATLENAKRDSDAPGPWWWMGSRCIPLRRTWLTGRDTHTSFDLAAQEWWHSGAHPEPLQ